MLRRIYFAAAVLIVLGVLMAGSNRDGLAQAVDHSSSNSGLSVGARERGDTGGKQPRIGTPDEPVGFVLDDGYSETLLGFGNSSANRSAAAIWLNRFTVPNTVPYPLTLTGMYIMFPDYFGGNFVGDQVQLLIYVDADSDGNPANATLVFHEIRTITTADWINFQLFPLSGTISTHGDLYAGWEDKWAEGGPQPREYIAAIDTTQSQHRSWLFGSETCCTPNVANLGLNDYQEVIDDLGYPGNFMIRLTVDSYAPPTATPTNTATPVPPRCPGETFTDVCPGDYFYAPVMALNQASIVSGYTSSPPCLTPAHVPCFLPANNVTRGQTSKIISLAAGFNDPVSGQSFEDVPVGSTFYTYIERLASRNIINGYACGGPDEPCIPPDNRPYFRPNANLTRGQLSKIASESFGYEDVTNNQTFEDVPLGSTFHTYIERLVMREIINGYPCGGPGEPCGSGNKPYFRPGNLVTRAQTAKIVYLAMTQPTPTPTYTATITVTSTPSTPTTPGPTQTPTTEVTVTGTPPTATTTSTPSPSPTCCTDVTGTITVPNCTSDPYAVIYSVTNNCPIDKRAAIAGYFEVSPNIDGPWQAVAVADWFDTPIPTGTIQNHFTSWVGPLPAGNNYWRYHMEFSGLDCSWHLSLISNPQPACSVGTVTPVTATPIQTSTPTNTPIASPTCCTDVTGTMNASCLPNPYTVTYSTTNNCPIQKTANIASMFEISPNYNGPWQTVYVGDCWDCPIPTGTTQHTITVFSGPLPSGNYYWRYRMEFSGSDCAWHLSLASNAIPACVVP